MNTNKLNILDKEELPLGGFAGIVETRMVMNHSIWPQAKANKKILSGLGDFIYLAYGHFKPNDGAPMHPHQDVDIVSFITSGQVGHKGSLGDGTIIEGPGVQVQRAGTGMQHSEFSVSEKEAGIVQIWFAPPSKGLQPDYKNFAIEEDKMTTVLGGTDGDSFNSNMICQVGYVADGEELTLEEPFVALITRGTAIANGQSVHEGQLINGDQATIVAVKQLGLVLIKFGENK